jgi:hypothetical protein
VEGGARPCPPQVRLDVIVLLVQALKDVENKGTILHVPAKVAEVVSHPLHLAAIVIDTQITLHEEPKLCVEVEGVRLAVVEELLLEGNPKLLSGAVAAVIAGTSGLREVDADGAKQPRQDHAIHPAPVGVVEGRSVGGDVVVEGVALERQQHEVAPARVLGGRDAEDKAPGSKCPRCRQPERGGSRRRKSQTRRLRGPPGLVLSLALVLVLVLQR